MLHYSTPQHTMLLCTTPQHNTPYLLNTPYHTTLHHTTQHNTPCHFTLHHETLHYPTLPHTTSHHSHHTIDMAALLITMLRISRGHSQRTNPGQRYYISTWSMHDWIIRKREDPSMSPRVSSCPCIRLHSHVNPLSPETRNINPWGATINVVSVLDISLFKQYVNKLIFNEEIRKENNSVVYSRSMKG